MDSNETILRISRKVSDKIGDEFFQTLAHELARELSCDCAVISRVDSVRKLASTLAFYADGKIQPNITYSMKGTPCEDVSTGGVCLYGTDVQELYPEDQILQNMGIHSFVGIRLSNADDESLGLLEILDTKPMDELDVKESILHVFGPRASAEIERLSSNLALKESEDRYRSLFESANDAYLLVSFETLCIDYCNRKALKIFNCKEKSCLTGKSVQHFYGEKPDVKESDNGQLEFSLKTTHLELTGKMQCVETRLVHDGKDLKCVEITSSIVMVNQQKYIMLIIRDLSKTQKLLRKLRKSRKALRRLAYRDTLTQLPNRVSLQGKLEKIAAKDRKQQMDTFMMILDLDNFKEINDSLGHHIGDELLKKIARSMRDSLPKEDACIYRLGGDEFAVILENSKHAEVEIIVNNLTEAVGRSYEIDNVSLNVGCSLGIANYSFGINSTSELMRAADIAMYKAKSSNITSSMFYNAEMDIYSRQRLRIISDLKPSLKKGEFVAYYQPKIDLKTMTVVGFEALARWKHAELGMISPLTFIEIAETSNDIKTLTNIILEDSCAAIKKWNNQGYDISIAVNISARVLLDDKLPSRVEKLLKRYKLKPSNLELEITESTLMKDPDRALLIANKITDLGVALSVDDFGTGYSSLSYLRRFPVKTLKIDREFVKDMTIEEQNRVIVRSVIDLAKNLRLNVVAEGIENTETIDLLQSMQCHQAQGYFFGRPMPEKEVSPWLENWTTTNGATAD